MPRPVEGETYPLDGDRLDLEPMVRDAVLLALPLAPLCDGGLPGPRTRRPSPRRPRRRPRTRRPLGRPRDLKFD